MFTATTASETLSTIDHEDLVTATGGASYGEMCLAGGALGAGIGAFGGFWGALGGAAVGCAVGVGMRWLEGA